MTGRKAWVAPVCLSLEPRATFAPFTEDDQLDVPIFIIITRPKPAYGRQGLAGLWGQDTDEVNTFWGILNVSLRACGAQLGIKPTWDHS